MDLRNSQLGHFKSVFHFVMNKKPIREEQKKLAKLLDWPYLDQNIGTYDTDSTSPIEIKTKASLGREQGSSIISNTESRLEQAQPHKRRYN